MSFQEILEDALDRQYMRATYIPAPNPIRIGERLAAHSAFAIHQQLSEEEQHEK